MRKAAEVRRVIELSWEQKHGHNQTWWALVISILKGGMGHIDGGVDLMLDIDAVAAGSGIIVMSHFRESAGHHDKDEDLNEI